MKSHQAITTLLATFASTTAAAVHGFDVSSYQDGVDFRKAYADGARFAIIKTTHGNSHVDFKSHQFFNQAADAGLIRGGYHVAQPDKAFGGNQAKFFLQNGGGWTNEGTTLPGMVVFTERDNPKTHPCSGLSPKDMEHWIIEFVEVYRASTGIYPLLYTTTGWWKQCTHNTVNLLARSLLVISDFSESIGELPAGWESYTFWHLANALKVQSRSVSTAAADAASRLMEKSMGPATIRRQVLDANQIQKLCLTLERRSMGHVDVSTRPPPTGTPIPPGYHLVYFTPEATQAHLGPDGSDATFNAPSPFTRRMWAGGEMSWPYAAADGGTGLFVGDEVEEHTRLVRATAKKGSAGDMILVEVEKDIYSSRGRAVLDHRSWIFRSTIDAKGSSLDPAPTNRYTGPTVIRDMPAQGDQTAVREITWSSSSLFRFSALTFNAHKIHFDDEWCRRVEGHPAPVVHGPLTLISLLDYWRDRYGLSHELQSIKYRAVSPIYAGDMYRIHTNSAEDSSPAMSYEMAAEKKGITCMKANVLSTRLDTSKVGLWFLKAPRLSVSRTQIRCFSLPRQESQKMLSALGVNVSPTRVGSMNDGKPSVKEHVKSDANWYLAMSVDRENHSPAILISKRGGQGIDEIAKAQPTSLFTFNFDLSSGITTKLLSEISKQLQLSSSHSTSLGNLLQQMYKIFSKDATLLEINPVAVSEDGTMTSVRPNFVFDDAAKKRQPEIFALRDKTDEVAEEVEAERHGLVYVRMQGNIGCVVNGAGLAMATNDAIGFEGGVSANFLDTGGKATTKTMRKAFEIVTRDERVKAILVNIYGGLTRCDMIAESIVSAAREMDIHVPMVVRLQGTNSEQGLKMIEEAKLGVDMVVESGWGAAKRVVELAKSS
ncbi:hypothetical protein CP533_1148 [Ophiocordyceps camponoti-saundersi (nom. inval.)]|nr:hypothetical protein CP533_1148 [Ophiocordyceps camponoti-saundersi (nom. inval.)]